MLGSDFNFFFILKEKGDGNSLILCVQEEDNMIHNQEGFFRDDVTCHYHEPSCH